MQISWDLGLRFVCSLFTGWMSLATVPGSSLTSSLGSSADEACRITSPPPSPWIWPLPCIFALEPSSSRSLRLSSSNRSLFRCCHLATVSAMPASSSITISPDFWLPVWDKTSSSLWPAVVKLWQTINTQPTWFRHSHDLIHDSLSAQISNPRVEGSQNKFYTFAAQSQSL